jgi:hypothetical protein
VKHNYLGTTIGGGPIIAAQFIFDVEPCQGVPFTFQIVSSRNRIDPTNIFLRFDEAYPIGVGETYNTPIIPELTGTNFRLTGDQINGFGIAMVESLGPGIFLIPNVTIHQLFNANINFGAIALSKTSAPRPIFRAEEVMHRETR